MSFEVRNTLLLIILFIMITASGFYFVHVNLGAELKNVEKINEEKRKKVKEIYSKVEGFDYADRVLKEIKERWMKREKVLKKKEMSGTTFKFLNDIAYEKDSRVKFDFTFKEKKTENSYGITKYSINGEGFYNNVYNFLYKIEHNREFCKIEDLNLKGKEFQSEESNTVGNSVDFSFILNVYSNPDEDEYESKINEKKDYTILNIDPFNPLVKKVLPPNNEGLIEVEDAKLEAVSYNMILIKDNKGRFSSLKVGDEVYLGYVSAIYPEKNEAEFTLNKGGFIKRVVLKMF